MGKKAGAWQVRLITLCLVFCTSALSFGQVPGSTGTNTVSIEGALEWDKMEINATLSLNLVMANIRLPSGRTRGEAMIGSEYLRLIRPCIVGLQADSSATLADLVERGEWSLIEAEELALKARGTPPFLTPDLRNLSASFSISIESISETLLRHSRPTETLRTLSPIPAPTYTGIIIIASTPLPVHGMKRTALAEPCLFPKIWDSSMNLIYERNMLGRDKKIMVRYASAENIFHETPSGLSPEMTALVGSKPLRIFARGVFGITPTDPIIDDADALIIISNEENRRLLREGKVVIILDNSALKKNVDG